MVLLFKLTNMLLIITVINSQSFETMKWKNKQNETDFKINFTRTMGMAKQSLRESDVLSRRKRFIIFPEGSSFQLVFCNTFPVITSIGDIFLWGYTSALAFELPQDPYSPFMHHADPLHRRMDTKTIYYTDENGKIINQHPAPKRKFIVNPAFAKRSVDSGGSSKTSPFKKGKAEKIKIDRKLMHAWQHRREFLKSEHMGPRSLEFHRRSRSLLYGKIETLLQSFGGNGSQCMLKTLCLVGQLGRTQNLSQGSFLQEILRAVFTFPKSNENDRQEDYDRVGQSSSSCEELYPCDLPAKTH